MSLGAKGLLLAALHLALVMSLAAKLHWDRARLPRVWIKADWSQRDQPLRGHYLRLELKVDLTPGGGWKNGAWPARLSVREGRLMADPSPGPARTHVRAKPDQRTGELVEALSYYVGDRAAHLPDRLAQQELWLEVSVPATGLPRPIRLGVLRGDRVEPLAVQ